MSTEKTIKENYGEFKSVIDLIVKDFEKFNIKNTKVAGVRVKSNLAVCRNLSEIIENQIMEQIRAIPSKHRADIVADTPVSPPEEEKKEPEKKVRKPRKANTPRPKQTEATVAV
jgi:hypothetical protein